MATSTNDTNLNLDIDSNHLPATRIRVQSKSLNPQKPSHITNLLKYIDSKPDDTIPTKETLLVSRSVPRQRSRSNSGGHQTHFMITPRSKVIPQPPITPIPIDDINNDDIHNPMKSTPAMFNSQSVPPTPIAISHSPRSDLGISSLAPQSYGLQIQYIVYDVIDNRFKYYT